MFRSWSGALEVVALPVCARLYWRTQANGGKACKFSSSSSSSLEAGDSSSPTFFGWEGNAFQTFGASTETWGPGIMKAPCERIIGASVQPGCFLRMCCQLLETPHPSGVSDASRSPFEQRSVMHFSSSKRDTVCPYSGFPCDGKCGW